MTGGFGSVAQFGTTPQADKLLEAHTAVGVKADTVLLVNVMAPV